MTLVYDSTAAQASAVGGDVVIEVKRSGQPASKLRNNQSSKETSQGPGRRIINEVK